MRPSDFDGSWAVVGPRMRALLTVAQARAAVDGAAYVGQALRAQGDGRPPAADVAPDQLAGVASSGGNIDDLLYVPVIRAKQQVAEGLAAQAALDAARRLLDGIMLTQVADAGRVASGLAIVAAPHVSGWVRQLVRPSCSRCVILAGKTFEWNRGFARHPRCDCVHIPVTEDTGDDLTTDPLGYFRSLSKAKQDETFGQAGAAAIRDGADIGQVVNARKGVYTASAFGRTISATHSGMTRRGAAGKLAEARNVKFANAGGRYQQATALRLMPEQIYKDATSRDDAIRLLRLYGYLR